MTDAKGADDGRSTAKVAAAKDQLNLILSFFPRVDTKLSVVLGIDLGMLSLLVSKLPMNFDGLAGWVVPSLALFVIAIVFSLIRLYQGAFPNVQNSDHSLVFFGDIAKMKRTDFVAEFSNQSTEELADALLQQAWRNSVILSDKFSSLKSAYRATVLGIVPWVLCLNLFLHLPAPAHG